MGKNQAYRMPPKDWDMAIMVINLFIILLLAVIGLDPVQR